jgi:dipeptidyl-peptidase-4
MDIDTGAWSNPWMRGPRARPEIVALAVSLAAGCAHPRAVVNANPEAARPAHTDFLEQYAATYRFRLGRPSHIVVGADGRRVVFVRSGPRSFDGALYVFDLETATERRVVTAPELAAGGDEATTEAEKAQRERMRQAVRGISSFQLTPDGGRALVPLGGRLFVVELDTGAHRELVSTNGPAFDPQLSPDGRQLACVRAGEVWIQSLETGAERRLTTGATDRVHWGTAEFVAQEEMARLHGLWWSPESDAVLVQRTDESGVETLHVMDPADPGKAPRSSRYPRAGTANAKIELHLAPIDGGPLRPVRWDQARYEYLANVKWSRGAPLSLVVQTRDQTELAVLAVDPSSLEARTLLVERDDTWLNLDPEMPRWLPDGRSFLWTTEREGFRQLERRSADGGRLGAVTDQAFGYRGLARLSADGRRAILRASPHPAELHLHRVALDGDARPERLTEGAGEHAGSFAAGSEAWVQQLDPEHGRPSWTVYGADGRRVGALASAAETPSLEPRPEWTEVEVEGRRHHAVLIRPHDFDPSRRYPVLLHVYGGPLHQMVTRSASRYAFDQWFAEQGFVVVSIDGRGTPGRDRSWERAIHRDLVTVPLHDQAAVLLALTERHPELDRDRIGIYGWSFGGYLSAMAALLRPDVFRAAVAGAPVTAWEDYDTHYTERYLQTPAANPDGYRHSSALTHAARLEVPLLLVHGTADDNVYFTHSLRLADALFRAGREADLLPLAGLTHMVADPLLAGRLNGRIARFLQDALGAPQPR